ncbi:YraN family protein [Hyphomicrobium sp. CS1BSMeth3]|uniref:YraN family protein n=1 Tax=Hyphomicrobium sp. CS1BSMeth3 TaxID=1892844 RepID=UPI00093055B2|nr:YraN family protein [Hyphomicrobium sp. CS1BSMeth3]
MSQPRAGDRLMERRRRLGRGRWAELVATMLILAKGYRILARRHVTPYGEVDIIASRRGRIAFIEVKRRATLADAEAALTPAQGDRISRAAEYWLSRHPSYLDRQIGLDAILVTARGWPRHIPNALDRM